MGTRARRGQPVRRVARRALPLVALVALALAASACSSGPEATNWVLDRPPEGRVLDVAVAIGSSTCHRFVGFDVEETGAEVHVIAYFDRDSRGATCTEDLSTIRQRVRLSRPLGDRDLTGCTSGIPQAPDPWGPIDDCRTVHELLPLEPVSPGPLGRGDATQVRRGG